MCKCDIPQNICSHYNIQGHIIMRWHKREVMNKIVKQTISADKGNAMVIMDREEYDSNLQQDKYRIIKKDPALKMYSITSHWTLGFIHQEPVSLYNEDWRLII